MVGSDFNTVVQLCECKFLWTSWPQSLKHRIKQCATWWWHKRKKNWLDSPVYSHAWWSGWGAAEGIGSNSSCYRETSTCLLHKAKAISLSCQLTAPPLPPSLSAGERALSAPWWCAWGSLAGSCSGSNDKGAAGSSLQSVKPQHPATDALPNTCCARLKNGDNIIAYLIASFAHPKFCFFSCCTVCMPQAYCVQWSLIVELWCWVCYRFLSMVFHS